MPDVLAYSGPINIRDLELHPDATALNQLRIRSMRSGVNRKIDGEDLQALILDGLATAGVTEYDAGVAYDTDDLVAYGGNIYRSLTAANTANTPSSSPSDWEDILAGLSGGGAPALSKSTTTAGGATFFCRYSGTAPTFATTGAGTFTLAVPAGTLVYSFDLTLNNASVDGSGDATLTITSTDGDNLYFSMSIIVKGTGEVLDDFNPPGITVTQTNPVAGQIVATLVAMDGNGATGYIILGRVI